MTYANTMLAAAVLAVAGLTAGCAALAGSPDTPERIVPGTPFAYEGDDFRMMMVQDDFVVVRLVRPDGNPGEITGWVDEVFRVSRYDLGEGRWYMYEGMPGAYLQWRGGYHFSLVRDREALAGAEVAILK